MSECLCLVNERITVSHWLMDDHTFGGFMEGHTLCQVVVLVLEEGRVQSYIVTEGSKSVVGL